MVSQVICGDCMPELIKTPNHFYDLGIVDPPFGIDASNMKLGEGGKSKYRAPHTFLDGGGKPTVRFTQEKGIFTFTEPAQNMKKVGKHKSGHQLDGETIQQFPE